MKVIYPGSFNPIHDGHRNILYKARSTFGHDNVYMVASKDIPGLLPDYIKEHGFDIMVRGLRNGRDFEYEKDLQYWYEDLGLTIPIVYFICNSTLCHISSSAIREVERIKNENN